MKERTAVIQDARGQSKVSPLFTLMVDRLWSTSKLINDYMPGTRDICKPQLYLLDWNAILCFSLKSSDSDEDSQVYIKKPPNAFMLFMKEQRPNVSKELWRKGSGAVNSHLATIVRLLMFFLNKCPYWFCWIVLTLFQNYGTLYCVHWFSISMF